MKGTSIGIDWVSMGIFLVAYAISQVNALSLKLRYAILAVACVAIAAFRAQRFGLAGTNGLFTALAVGLGVYYIVRTVTARDRPKVSHDDD